MSLVDAVASPFVRDVAMSGGKTAFNSAEWAAMPLWKITPPKTTDIAVAMSRMKNMVAAALAMSYGLVRLNTAMIEA